MVSPVKNSFSSTRIILPGISSEKIFPATEATELTFDQEGIEIGFEANSFVDESGASYNGNVQLQLYHLSAIDPNLGLQAPGDFRAYNMDSEVNLLQTFGMFSINIFDDQGTELRIAEDKQAIIRYNPPQEIITSIPESIPMWHFDASSGYWLEEGLATFDGMTFEGKVNHFSWWNFDLPLPFVNLSGVVLNDSNAGIENIGITAQLTNSPITFGITYTNAEGKFQGIVPANEEILIRYFDNCGEVFNESILTTGSSDFNLGNVTSVGPAIIEVCGQLVDCDQQPVSNGYVSVNFGDFSSIININDQSEFCQNIIACQGTGIEISGIDLNSQLQSDPQSFQMNESPINLPELRVCDQIALFFKYAVNGNEYIVPDFSVGQSGQEVFFQDNTNFQEVSGFISSADWSATDFMPGYFNVDLYDDENPIDTDPSSGGISVQMLEYNGLGNYFYIKFNGGVDNNTFLVELSAILE